MRKLAIAVVMMFLLGIVATAAMAAGGGRNAGESDKNIGVMLAKAVKSNDAAKLKELIGKYKKVATDQAPVLWGHALKLFNENKLVCPNAVVTELLALADPPDRTALLTKSMQCFCPQIFEKVAAKATDAEFAAASETLDLKGWNSYSPKMKAAEKRFKNFIERMKGIMYHLGKINHERCLADKNSPCCKAVKHVEDEVGAYGKREKAKRHGK